MKKNLLALSVAAALGTGASVAMAQSSIEQIGTGNALVVPYYTVQNGNATLINIVNTDTVNGKAVKVRFRGASRSDDVFDFQVFLSPYDMWTANVSVGPDGIARLTTTDTSCTLPADVNQSFVTVRLERHFDEDELAEQTREGYVEIINMGDVIDRDGVTTLSTSDARRQLFDTIKHSNGVPACSQSVLETIVSTTANAPSETGTDHRRLSNSATGGLMANATIINVEEASAWGVEAEVVNTNGPLLTRYWSQTDEAFSGTLGDGTGVNDVTLDAVFLRDIEDLAQYDLPDLSTPRGGWSPMAQVGYVNNNIIGESAWFANEYITDDSIFAETDWVMSMPTRRYQVEERFVNPTDVSQSSYSVLNGFSAVVKNNGCLDVDSFKFYDREERTTGTGVVISPGQVQRLELCGEVAVVSFNRGGVANPSGALGAEITLNDATLPYQDGWASISFDAALPIIPYAFIKANNGGSGATNMNFGGVWRHRVGGDT
ncbi:hypothetical protein [Pseudazoarcus pumilus]|uniref:Cell surface protein n=1 Tax=Pseudazoarcus pumilus TaxID=2067960 RepID=A0A2I6S906_9RHOO|nr:hypothetical protein [Pseudazoarcus pumilus]AUN95749.1 hypothetical protein C0099_12885 [Pseudazoarcus pumilus]